METININGVEYIAKSEYDKVAAGKKAAGYVEKREGKEVTIRKVRRIWYWDGANSLSQLAVDGTLKPKNCKFACEVDTIIVTEAIEVIPCTEKARKSIMEVEEWKLKD